MIEALLNRKSEVILTTGAHERGASVRPLQGLKLIISEEARRFRAPIRLLLFPLLLAFQAAGAPIMRIELGRRDVHRRQVHIALI